MILVGTSGWHYDHWRGPFYPADLPAKDFLSYYQQYFQAVEINSSFYRLPTIQALTAWREGAPPGFRFAVKASRVITHLKKLRGVEQVLATFLERVSLLGPTLGPLLFQLPPRWHRQPARLAAFLAKLPPSFRPALEFRDPSWLVPEIYDLLRQYRAALCFYEFAGYQSPLEVTADFVYIRLHGPQGPYQGNYPLDTLQTWTRRLLAWEAAGLEVYCFFDNDEAGFAAHNALTVRRLLAGRRTASAS
ncbi:MAG: DUF72 domain-containing protein [Desulfobacca sp.]|uniref:DUF72 domain-containing protein n=1 Tax=Desulfobacca sp. TaxID=2067990 RepID=UPI00404B08B8